MKTKEAYNEGELQNLKNRKCDNTTKVVKTVMIYNMILNAIVCIFSLYFPCNVVLIPPLSFFDFL